MKKTTTGFQGLGRGISTITVATFCAAVAISLGGAACEAESDVGDPHEGETLDDQTATAASAHHLEPAEIQGVVRASFGSFRQCYEALLKTTPAAAGKVTVSFKIDEDGEVLDVSADSTFADPAIGACIADGFRDLEFAAHDETTTVTYPIAFSPDE